MTPDPRNAVEYDNDPIVDLPIMESDARNNVFRRTQRCQLRSDRVIDEAIRRVHKPKN